MTSQASQIHRLPSQTLSQLLSDQTSSVPLSTSIKAFDEMLEGGLYPGQIYEICGIQGSGKSSLASQLVKNSLCQKKQVLWISSLQSIPIDTIKRFIGLDNQEALSKLHHIRLDSISALFIFIQSLNLKPTKFALIIIDDFASLISRCFDSTEQSGSKYQSSQDHKRNRAIQSILKQLSTYCAINNSICTIFNSSTILNMSFVETKADPISNSQQLMQPPSSSQSFMGSLTPRPKPKRLYQQVLVSPLGDHPTWSSYFKARLMSYKDWTTSSSTRSTANFVHLKQNRLQKHSNIVPKVVNFQESHDGIIEVGKRDLSMAPNITNSFTLEEGDFGTDGEEEEEEDIDELRTTGMNANPIVLLESSPRRHNDISTAKNILPDDLTNAGGVCDTEGEKDDRVVINDVVNNDNPSEASAQVRDGGDEAESSQAIKAKESTLDDDEELVEHQEEEKNDNEDNENNGEDISEGNIGESTNDIEEMSNQIENDNEVQDNDSSIEHLREDEFNEQNKENEQPEYEIRSFTIPNEPLPMAEDTSIEYEEIEDELEELYPTQPESLHPTQLSQIPSPPRPRRKFDPENLSHNVKRLRLPLQVTTNTTYDDSYGSQMGSDEYIPASAPYF